MRNKTGGILLIFFLSVCAQITEVGRTAWGTSTRALNDERVDAITLTYECYYDACYSAVLDLTKNQLVDDQLIEKEVTLFQQNYIKGYIVLMGVEGNVDTTEVGVFFSHIKQNVTKIEISSLSATAKEKVAEAIETHLTKTFSKIN